MALRSDFKITAVTPTAVTPEESAVDSHPKPNLTEQTQRDLRAHVETVGIPEEHVDHDKRGHRHEARPATTPESGPEPYRVAFLVTHGMGQQVPFETLSMIGQALVTEHSKRHPQERDDEFKVSVRRVQLTSAADAPELSRAEVAFPPRDGKSVEAHIYESYWAPLTEGQISFLQTVGFLYSAAWNGLWTYFLAAWHRKRDREGGDESPEQADVHKQDDGFVHFDRWLFGEFHDMPIKEHTFGLLIATVLSVTFLLIPAVMLFTPAGLTVSKKIVSWSLSHFANWHWEWQTLAVAITLGFVVVALWVRYFIVEYVGDVAIYVSSYKVSRFDAIRNQILSAACTVARQVYSAGIVDKLHPRYDAVVIVGHSLGSVISYDLLNAAINWDEIECNFKREVVPRTSRFITFGSPLDKTAFLFRTQVSDARNLREALAARMQPLILNYEKFRPLKTFRWINIYSKWDIISGCLDYYDADKEHSRNPVDNKIDPQATRPLLAHVQYWNNALLHEELYEAAWASVGAQSGVRAAKSSR